MNAKPEVMLSIPIKASYRIENGKAIRESATYADISADEMARFLIRGFGLPCPNVEEEPK